MPEDSRKARGGTPFGPGRERQAPAAAEEISTPETMMFSGRCCTVRGPIGTCEPVMENIRVLSVFHEPPYAERHVRWCERQGSRGPRLLDCLRPNLPAHSDFSTPGR